MDYIKIGEDLKLTWFNIEERLKEEIKLREDEDDGSDATRLDIEFLNRTLDKLDTLMFELANYYIER